MATDVSGNVIDGCIAELRQRIAEIEGVIAMLTRMRATMYPPPPLKSAAAATPVKKPRAPYGSKTRGGKPVIAAANRESTTVVATKPKSAAPPAKSATEKICDALSEHGPMTPKALETITGLPPHVIGARIAVSDHFRREGDLVKLT